MPRISTDNYDTVASWNGSEDLFVVEQPDGTKVATPAMVKQYILGNSIDDIYSVMGQNGAKNLINYPYYDPSGRTNRGITYTYDKDGIITANGSTDANNQSYMTMDDFSRGLVLPSTKKYTLTCEKTNDNNKGFAVLYFKNADNTAKTVSIHAVYEDGTTRNANSDYVSLLYNNVFHTSVTFWVDTDTIYITQVRIHTNSGTITNAVLKPMLRLAEDTDDTYQPYAKTNKELTEVIGDLSQTGLTGDSVSEQLADVGEQLVTRTEYFISSTNGTTQIIDIGVAPTENRTFLFACGFHTNHVLELIAMSGAGNIAHIPIANSSISSISNISYDTNTGVMTITVLNNPFSKGRMTRLS